MDPQAARLHMPSARGAADSLSRYPTGKGLENRHQHENRRDSRNVHVELRKTGDNMKLLIALAASDLIFAAFIWWTFHQHNKKMAEIYEKYDTKRNSDKN